MIVKGLKYKVKRFSVPIPDNNLHKPDFKEIEDFLNSDEMEEFVYITNVDWSNDKGQTFSRFIDIFYKSSK
jgi:hypothetical protein